jgi:hypothetical protein
MVTGDLISKLVKVLKVIMILDHARDESRHHAYFASLLKNILWF